jgi:hypothetical protein
MLDNKKKGGVTVPALITFMVSAIWHGFYPGFVFFFFGAFLMDLHQKVAMPVAGPLFSWLPQTVKDVSCTVFYYFACSYFFVSFFLLNFCDFHKVYSDMYYGGHILIMSQIAFCMMLQTKPSREKPAKTD